MFSSLAMDNYHLSMGCVFISLFLSSVTLRSAKEASLFSV